MAERVPLIVPLGVGAASAFVAGTLLDKFNVFGNNPEGRWWWERMFFPRVLAMPQGSQQKGKGLQPASKWPDYNQPQDIRFHQTWLAVRNPHKRYIEGKSSYKALKASTVPAHGQGRYVVTSNVVERLSVPVPTPFGYAIYQEEYR